MDKELNFELLLKVTVSFSPEVLFRRREVVVHELLLLPRLLPLRQVHDGLQRSSVCDTLLQATVYGWLSLRHALVGYSMRLAQLAIRSRRLQ